VRCGLDGRERTHAFTLTGIRHGPGKQVEKHATNAPSAGTCAR
jgi:hypothetical protein